MEDIVAMLKQGLENLRSIKNKKREEKQELEYLEESMEENKEDNEVPEMFRQDRNISNSGLTEFIREYIECSICYQNLQECSETLCCHSL